MTILVTGQHGFLGRHIAARFAAAGHAVVGAGRPEIEIPSAAFEQLLATAQPDLVVHCAGPASVPASIADPDADRAGAVEVLRGLLERLGSARLVLVSSAAVYGQPEGLPIGEDTPLAPVSPYGRARVEAEQLAAASGVPLVIARVFSAYGEGLRKQVLWDIAARALAGGPIRLSGTGEETRDFVHARDVAAAIAAIAERGSFEGEAVNVATGAETSIARLAQLLTEELGAGGTVRFSGVGRPGDPERWRADITRLRELGFEPAVAIEDGAAAYARWARSAA
jgi:UDP-glucose 4-epimerase